MSIRSLKKKLKKGILESAMMRDVHQAHMRMWWDGSRKTTCLDINILADGRSSKVWISRKLMRRVAI